VGAANFYYYSSNIRIILIFKYRRIALPSFLINYFGQKRIGKILFLAENGSIKKKC
jgi:hypothetical protein